MRHFPRNRYTARTFFDHITIQFEGSPKCGASFDVEVEFTETPYIPARGPSYASGGEPACGSEREIVAVRPYEYQIDKATGRLGTSRTYLDCPKWLAESLIDCVDVDTLTSDWSEED